MVSAAHKLHVDLDTLRRRFAVALKGATLQELMAHAGALQFSSRALRLEADVLQERRKVWEWVLEPLLAARAQLKVLGAEPKAASSGS